jgi:hypothetical protein
METVYKIVCQRLEHDDIVRNRSRPQIYSLTDFRRNQILTQKEIDSLHRALRNIPRLEERIDSFRAGHGRRPSFTRSSAHSRIWVYDPAPRFRSWRLINAFDILQILHKKWRP